MGSRNEVVRVKGVVESGAGEIKGWWESRGSRGQWVEGSRGEVMRDVGGQGVGWWGSRGGVVGVGWWESRGGVVGV